MAIVSRSKLNHPAEGAAGGTALHTQVETLYTTLGDNDNSRYAEYSAIANSTTVELDHNFGANLSELNVLIYSGAHPSLTRITDPESQSPPWTIQEKAGSEKLIIEIITPSSGGPHTFAVLAIQGKGSEKLNDLSDVDVVTTAPEDGQALVYDSGSTTWIPGASGDSSFKIQDLTGAGVITYKSGFMEDQVEGVELQLAADASPDISSVVTSDGDYYAYIDRTLLPAITTVNGREVRVVDATNDIVYLTDPPNQVDKARYIVLGAFQRSGATFQNHTTYATRNGDGPAQFQALEYELSPQAIGAIGASGQIQAGHILDAESFDSTISGIIGFWNLNDVNDDSGNSLTQTNIGSIGFSATDIKGTASRVAEFDGSTKQLDITNSFFDLNGATQDLTFGTWIYAPDYTPASDKIIWQMGAGTTIWTFLINSSGELNVSGATGAMLLHSAGLTDANWYHVGVRNDTSTNLIELFINGSKVASAPNSDIGSQLSSSELSIGGSNSGTARWDGRMQDFFAAKTRLSDDAIRKLWSHRIDHNRNIAIAAQTWTGSEQIASGPSLPLENFETGRNENSLWVDLSGRADTNTVSMRMLNTGQTGSVLAPRSRTYAGTATEIDALFPITHGLGGVPSAVLEVEDVSGQYFEADGATHYNKSSTQIISTGATLAATYGGAKNIILRLAIGPLASSLPAASTTTAGVIEANTQIFRRVSASGNIFHRDKILDDTGGLTLTLPASPNDEDVIEIYDELGNWGASSTSVARNGNLIGGLAGDLLLNIPRGKVKLIYNLANTDWRVF